MSEQEDPIAYLQNAVAGGEHWYIALLRTMSRWDQPEEVIDGRRYRYLLGGEAFDWLLLAERLLDEIDGAVSEPEREAMLFHGQPPLEIDDEEFQLLIGTPKYQAYLNFLYGVTCEEALQLAVEEEIAKERHAHVWSNGDIENEAVFNRLYGKSQLELLQAFQKERKLSPTDHLDLVDLKEFTYWLFKMRVRSHEGARVASDTRKGLAALSRVELAFRKRLQPDPVEPEAVEV